MEKIEHPINKKSFFLYNSVLIGMDESAMDSKKVSFGKWVRKGLQRIISLTLGESDFGIARHTGGDLRFNEECMEVLEIDFDSEGKPRPKVFKLNLLVIGFFNRIKNNLGTINAIYLVLSDRVVMQFESFGQEWRERFKNLLNREFQLNLDKIHYVRESDILHHFNRPLIRERMKSDTPYYKNPYCLKSSEFLIIAGGFINFKYLEPPVLKETKGIITDYKAGETIATIEVDFFKIKNNSQMEKIHIQGDYPVKYSPNAGAYFYIGGEWYHNLFVPEFHDKEKIRYVCFRIDDDGKYIRFFPDSEKRHIPICLKKPEKNYGPDFIKLTYAINPEYISNPEIIDFKIGIRYEAEGGYEPENIIPEMEESAETSIKTLSWKEIKQEIKNLDKSDKGRKSDRISRSKSIDPDILPFLITDRILLPRPGIGPDDIPSYVMNIGDEQHYVRFRVSSPDNEVSILSSYKKNLKYQKPIGDKIDFSAVVKGHNYSFSDDFISRIDDAEIKLYFSWTLESTAKEKILLKSDHYLIGRDPVTFPSEQTIRLNRTGDEFWRIGSSRNHAWLGKGENGYILFNLSATNSVYVIKFTEIQKPKIVPLKLDPVSGKSNLESLEAFLSQLRKKGNPERTSFFPRGFCQFQELENNDLLIIGNRTFFYVQPLVMESPLEGNARTFMKTIQHRKAKLS